MALAGKVAFVTGAGSGMGQAIAWSLAAESMEVVAVGRSLEKLEATVAGNPGPGRIHHATLDVSARRLVTEVLGEFMERLGTPFLLVNNAGINIRNRASDLLTPEDFDRVVATNLTGVFNVTSTVLPAMRATGDGVVVTISSVAGVRPFPLAGAAYSASKFGVHGLMGTIGREVAEAGIRCTIIAPGEAATPILDDRPVKVTAEHRARILQPQDIADAVLFIAKLPPRAHVPEMVIKPLSQDYA